ncbi:hypothetical protein AB0F72_33030 [Actinoplanes sp. NPDC023936]|uniref:hypothetical protein n=1 Tax=Actinoplanes sp. NPDC023936 TaxID=3154910 RepID=UPI0033CE0BA7
MKWRRDLPREEQIVRALMKPPEPVHLRGARRWRDAMDHWQDWLRESATGVELYTRATAEDEYRYLLGDDAYRRQLIQILARVAPRDCAAARFGCTRRMDRACRGPEICSQDRPAGADGTPDGRVRREGPLPGACDTFYRETYAGERVRVEFSAGDRHRAVTWTDDQVRVRLWIDGVRVGERIRLGEWGRWLDDRFYVIEVDGPDDHPEQDYGFGGSVINSVLIHDADRSSDRVLEPGPGERWTTPWVVRAGDELLIFPDRQAAEAGASPDRTLPAIGDD